MILYFHFILGWENHRILAGSIYIHKVKNKDSDAKEIFTIAEK